MKNITKIILLITLILIALLISAIPAWADPYLRITQTVPAAFVNDNIGRTYQARLQNTGNAAAQNVSATLTLPAGFTFKPESLNIAVRRYNSGTGNFDVDNGYTANVSGTNPVTITFSPTLNLNPGNAGNGFMGDYVDLTYQLTTSTGIAPGNTYILQVDDYYDYNNPNPTPHVDHLSERDQVLVDIKQGQVSLTLTPISPLPFQARRGDTVTLEARITNTGNGSLFNINLRTDWGTGFNNPQLVVVGGTATSVELTPAGSGNGYQITTGEIPAGQSVFFRYRLTVNDYQNFSLTGTATDPVYPSSPYTDSVIFTFMMNQPDISITPHPITIAYGNTASTSISVTNNSTDQGPARQFVLNTNINSQFNVTLTGASASEWSYSGGVFTYIANGGVINPTQTVNLTFDVAIANPGALTGDRNGSFTIRPSYQNDIVQTFTYPVASQSYSIINVPTLHLAQTIVTGSTDGDNLRVFLGEPFRFDYTPTLTNVSKWNGTDIVLTNNLTSDFTLGTYSATAGTVTVNGALITWTLTPAQAAASPTLSVNVQTTNDWNRAGNFLYNTATITGTSIMGCTISDSVGTTFYLQSRDEPAVFNRETKSYTNLPAEGSYDVAGVVTLKNQIAYQLDYRFSASSGGYWTGSTLTEGMDQNQVYVAETVQYSTNLGASWTDVPAGSILSNAPLQIDLSFLKDVFGGDDQIQNKNVMFRYTLALTNASLASGATTATTFIARTDLVLSGATNGAVTGDGKHHFYEGVFVPISRAAMSVSSTLDTTTVSKGQVVRMTITATKLTPWNNNNLIITVPTNGRYSYRGNLASAGFNGMMPTATIFPAFPDTITFTFPDPLNVNQGGTISFDLVKTDDSNYSIPTQLDFKDDLNVQYPTVSYTYTPTFCVAGTLSLSSTPNPVKVANNTVAWDMLVTNMGDGTAYGVVLEDVLKNILAYSSSTVDGNGVTLTPADQGNGTSKITWNLGDFIPGQSKTIHVVATTSGLTSDFSNANNLTGYMTWTDRTPSGHYFNYAYASLSPTFTQLSSSGFTKNECDPPPVELCGVARIKLYVKNNGLTTNYNYIITQNLGQTGFDKQADPKTFNAKIDGVAIADPVYDAVNKTLTFSYADNPSVAKLQTLAPQEEFWLTFDVQTHESFNSYQQIQPSATWQLPTEKDGSNRTGNTTGALYRVPQILPNITVAVDGLNVTKGESSYTENVVAVVGEQVEWRIRITNSGSAAAKNVTLNNTLPTNMTFDSISPAVLSDIITGSSWKIADIVNGATVTYYVRATFSGSCGPSQQDLATVTWGPETSSLSTPGTNHDTANYITQASVDSVSASISPFTTKIGTVTVTLVTSGAPLYNLSLPLNISNRFKVNSAMTYSSGLLGPTSEPVMGTPSGVGDVLSWHWNGPISAGTYTITFDIRDADSNCNDGSAVSSSNNYSYQNSRNDTFNQSYTFDQTPGKASLTVTKTPSVQVAQNGSPIAWTITVTNTGNTAATNLEIVDTLGDGTTDNGFTYVSSSVTGRSDSPTRNGNILTWSGITLNPGASYIITENVTAHDSGLHTTSVTATEWNIDKTAKVDEKTAKALVAMVSFTKTLDQTIANPDDPVADSFGEIVKYTIQMNVADTGNYQNMTISDTLPTGLEYVDESHDIQNFNPTVSFNQTGKNLTWTLGSFTGPGIITLTYHVRIWKEGAVTGGSTITNSAKMNFEILNADSSVATFPNSLTALQAAASFTVKTPSISLSSKSSIPASASSVTAGTAINHTLVVTNGNGANVSAGYEVKVTETLPAGERTFDPTATVVVKKGGTTLSVNVDYTISYNGSSGALVLTFEDTSPGILQKNENFNITYQTNIDANIGAGVNLTNSTMLNQYYSQPTSTTRTQLYTGNTRTTSYNTVTSGYIMTITSPVNKKVRPGMIVTYQSQITIPAGTSVYDVGLSQTLPTGLDYVAGSSAGLNDSGGTYRSLTPTLTGNATSGETLTWSVAGDNVDISNNGASNLVLTITFNAVVLDAAAISNGNTKTSTFVYNYDSVDNTPGSRTNSVGVSDSATVAEPVLTIAKTILSGGPYEAGSTFQYQLTVTNTSATETAYDTQIGSLLSGKAIYGSNSPSTAMSFSRSGQQLTWGGDGALDIAPGASVSVDVTVTLNSLVEPLEILQNTGTVTYSSMDGTITQERIYNGNIVSNNDIGINDPTAVTKTIVGAPTYVIGEPFNYQVVLTILKGTTENVIVRDTLPTDVEILSYTINNGNNGISYGAVNGPSANATGTIVWNFGTVTNPDNGTPGDETITIQYTVRLKNTTNNNAGNIRTNSAQISYSRYVGGSLTTNTVNVSSNPSLTIKEPQLRVSKSYTVGTWQAGSTVGVTVRIWHNSTGSPHDVTAYNLQVTDIVPAKMLNPSSISNSGIAGPGSVTWTINSFDISHDAAHPLTLTYQVTLDNTIQPGEQLSGAVSVLWESFPGINPQKRTGADGAGGALNDYDVNSSATTNAVDATAFAHTLTGGVESTIGAKVPFQIKITLNEGTTANLAAYATLPAGMKFDHATITKGHTGMSYTDPIGPAADAEGTVSWNFETVQNPADGNATDDTITIDYWVIIMNVSPGNIRGTVLTIPAHIEYQDGSGSDVIKPSQNQSVTLAEPNLSIVKSGPGTVALQTLASFTITVNNNGNSTAWQTTITDTLPAEMRAQSPTITAISVGGRSLHETGPDDYDLSYNSSSGVWTVSLKSNAARIAAGESLTITYQARLNNQVFTISTITNVAAVGRYYSIDSVGGAGPDTRTYPSVTVSASADVIIQTPELVITPSVDKTTAYPGDVLHYQITIQNNGNINVTDAVLSIESGTNFTVGSIANVTSTSGMVTANGSGGSNGTGSFGITGINIPSSGGSVTIGWDITVRMFLPNNTVVGHTGIMTVADFPTPTTITIPTTTIQSANLNGTVWFDSNCDNDNDSGEVKADGWRVELLQNNNNTPLSSTTTDSNGHYQFSGIVPGSNYRIRFSQSVGTVVWRTVAGITLQSGAPLTQDFPIHPTGVVYDAVTRLPVSGATVTISGPVGFNPAQYLENGQQGQVTGADGRYRFNILFEAGAPAGTYRITVTPPNTYSPAFPSTIIAPEAGAFSPGPGEVAPVVSDPDAPSNADPTTYYRSFDLDSGSADIVNNHIPLDPILGGAIILTKTAAKKTAAIGDIVVYTITMENTTAALITPITLQDVIPAGFKYVKGSAAVGNVKLEPVGDRTLSWMNLTLQPNGRLTVTYALVIGAGVSEGNLYKNSAEALHGITGTSISNVGVAGVQIVSDPVFTNALVIGKVFNDKNKNGIQDEDEEGLAGVKLFTVNGQIITTDKFGRYHLDGINISSFSKGQNFIIKVDPLSLPKGARFTTENPRVVRITQGVMVKINFGVKIPEEDNP